MIKQNRREKQEKVGKTKHHARRVIRKKKKKLKLKSGPFKSLKASSNIVIT